VSARGKLTGTEVALAFLIGLGFLLMALAAGLGAAFGDFANESLYGMLFALGFVAFIIGIALWLWGVQPWTQFDDINVPKDTGHHGHEAHEA